MTHFIAHRINTVEELKALPIEYGVELDLRDSGNDLILQHDPFKGGESFNDYLKYYQHGTMILNIKSERIEHRVLDLLKEHNITDYFFLDSSFPKIIDLVKKNFKKISLRVSFYESAITAKKLKGKVNWIWFDTFKGLPKNLRELKYLKYELKYKICLVCPKLHNQTNRLNSKQIQILKKNKLIDAVCTKEKYFKEWI